MKTAAVMTRDIVVVSPNVTAPAAQATMGRLCVRHLPVVENGRLVGIISDRDLLRRPSPASPPLTCGQVMTPAPVTCRASTSVGQVARSMLEHKIDCVPVVDDEGRLVGLVTSSDLLELLVERDQAQALPPFDFRLRLVESDNALVATA
jgi:acetoin utilization protein AcuB